MFKYNKHTPMRSNEQQPSDNASTTVSYTHSVSGNPLISAHGMTAGHQVV